MVVCDEHGTPVNVTERGMLSGLPARVQGREFDTSWIRSWAGPWLLDERWWLAEAPVVSPREPLIAIGGEPAGPYSLGPGDSAYDKPPRNFPSRLSGSISTRARSCATAFRISRAARSGVVRRWRSKSPAAFAGSMPRRATLASVRA